MGECAHLQSVHCERWWGGCDEASTKSLLILTMSGARESGREIESTVQEAITGWMELKSL